MNCLYSRELIKGGIYEKLFALSIFFILLMVFPITVNAVDESDYSPMFIALISHINNLNIEGSAAACTGSASCSNGYSVKISLYLERYVNNRWTTVSSWNGDKDIYSYVNETITVSSDYNYRVKSVATVYDENNKIVEAPVLYSNVVIN